MAQKKAFFMYKKHIIYSKPYPKQGVFDTDMKIHCNITSHYSNYDNETIFIYILIYFMFK